MTSMLHPTPIRCRCAEPGSVCLVPHGQWLIARTSAEYPYPCRCRKSCHPVFCPCAGRLDTENLEPGCCAQFNTPAVVTEAKREYDRERRAANR